MTQPGALLKVNVKQGQERSVRGKKLQALYHCNGCERAFMRENNLRRHAETHTNRPVHR